MPLNFIWVVIFILYDNLQAMYIFQMVNNFQKFKNNTSQDIITIKKLMLFTMFMDFVGLGLYSLFFINRDLFWNGGIDLIKAFTGKLKILIS